MKVWPQSSGERFLRTRREKGGSSPPGAIMFGTLNSEQQRIVSAQVRGKTVHDFGASDLRLSRVLVGLGADRVIAIEKEKELIPKVTLTSIQVFHGHFRSFTDPVDTAFVSWPVNWNSGLEEIVERSPVVIYLGTNMDGTSCGYSSMWRQLAKREILESSPDRKNTLIVYGPLRVVRDLHPEEKAALSNEMVSFHTAYKGST